MTGLAASVFAAADLVPIDVTARGGISPDSFVAVSYTVSNQGDANAPASHTRVVIRNKAGTAVAADIFTSPAIAANTSVTEIRQVLIPGTVFPGTYTAYVSLDIDHDVVQASTDNDTGSSAAFMVVAGSGALEADLLPLNVTASSPVTAGSAVAVNYLVRNQGGYGVPSTRSRVEIRDETGASVTFQVAVTPAMNPGDVIADTQLVTIPLGTPPGTYRAYVLVDVAGSALQGATNNDASFGTTFIVQAGAGSPADLLPQNVTTNGPITAGNALTVNYALRNQGGTKAPASHTKVQITNSVGAEIAAQTFATAAIDGLAATSETRSLPLPASVPAGTYFAYVLADAGREVTQGNATGNDVSAGAAFTVGAARLFSVQPQSQAVASGSSLTLSAAMDGQASYQWQRNGLNLGNATSGSFTLGNLRPDDAGLYRSVATSGAGAAGVSDLAIIGIAATARVVGAGELAGTDIRHTNGNVFDQVLLTGAAEAITADGGKITRTSYIDLNNDIVQIEFSGAGTLALVLDGVPDRSLPVNYNQDIAYMRGHAGIIITGANETTNLSIFTVGRATAFDPTGGYDILRAPSSTNNPANNGSPLFQGHADTVFDGVADLAFVAISSANGKFGGIRAANAEFFATSGIAGLYAPGVAFQGPVFIGDIDAREGATPMLVVGSASDVRITGGDMAQSNGNVLEVSGLSQVQFVAGVDSNGRDLPAQSNLGVWQHSQDVTAQVIRRGTIDLTPDTFRFVDVTNGNLNATYISNPIQVLGITSLAPVSITGGAYSINDGPFSTAPGTVKAGDQVTVRHISSTAANTTTSARLTIGDVSDAYDVTTAAGPSSTYLVRAGASLHGSVSPSGLLSVGSARDLIFTATPDNGWKLNQWLVNGMPVASAGNSYTLSNPTGDTTVQAAFGVSFAADMVLSKGEAKTRSLAAGGTDLWTISVEAGEMMLVRVGELWGSTYFAPRVEIRDPSGSVISVGASNGDAMATYRAPVTGTYMIGVSSIQSSETGAYRIEAVKIPAAVEGPVGDDGGAFTRDSFRTGAITNGDIDTWAITVSDTAALFLQIDKLTGTTDFRPSVLLYDPFGNLVASNNGEANTVLNYQPRATGIYTLVIYSYTAGQTGTYLIH